MVAPENAQLKLFLLDRTDEEEEREDDGVASLTRRHQTHQAQKQLYIHMTKPTKYRCLKHIYSTTNCCVEMFYSRESIQSMAPHQLESRMFLRFNRLLWNARVHLKTLFVHVQ